VPEAEEEPNGDRSLSERDEPPQDIVDRADVVRVQTMTQTKRPRDQAQRQHIVRHTQEDGERSRPSDQIGNLPRSIAPSTSNAPARRR